MDISELMCGADISRSRFLYIFHGFGLEHNRYVCFQLILYGRNENLVTGSRPSLSNFSISKSFTQVQQQNGSESVHLFTFSVYVQRSFHNLHYCVKDILETVSLKSFESFCLLLPKV